jgi:stage II sporulation protein AA (anti-sigma F factor antagonist)
MNIKSERDGTLATVGLDGVIDTRAAQEFEKHIVGLFAEGARSVIVDLSKVDLITSAGIRVLVMMAQRLGRSGGALVLCALSAKVRGVFDIAGLLTQFKIVDSRGDAAALIATLAPAAAPAAPARTSKLTDALLQLLEEDRALSPSASPGRGSPSKLAQAVRGVLQRGIATDDSSAARS